MANNLYYQLCQNFNFFDENYIEEIFDFELNSGEKPHKLGGNGTKICRFCKRKEPEVRFSKVAHCIPRFLGNQRWISNYDCDECNENIFSKMEGDLQKFLQLPLVINRIRGRYGVPTLKDSQILRIEYDTEKKTIIIKCKDEDFDIDCESGSFILNSDAKTQAFVPINIAKILVKCVCSVLDEATFNRECSTTLKWLIDDKIKMNKFPIVTIFQPGPLSQQGGRLRVFIRKTNIKSPFIWCVLELGAFQCQFFVPFCKADENWQQPNLDNKIDFFIFPPLLSKIYFEQYGYPQIELFDASGDTKKKIDCGKISFRFNSIEKTETLEECIPKSISFPNVMMKCFDGKLLLTVGTETHEYNLQCSFASDTNALHISSFEFPLLIEIRISDSESQKVLWNFELDENIWEDSNISSLYGIGFLSLLLHASKVKLVIGDNPFGHSMLAQPSLNMDIPNELIEKLNNKFGYYVVLSEFFGKLSLDISYREIKNHFYNFNWDMIIFLWHLQNEQKVKLQNSQIFCSFITASQEQIENIKTKENLQVTNSDFIMVCNYKILFDIEYIITKYQIEKQNDEDNKWLLSSLGDVYASLINLSYQDIRQNTSN